MPSLRLVRDDQAGPRAVGILVPPGMPTVLVVRPRALGWDLLLVQGAAGPFRQMGRDEAAETARAFYEALQAWNRGGPGHVAAIPSSAGAEYLVWADVGDFCLVVCERVPGQPYRPRLFGQEDEARRAAADVAGALHPPHAEQEVYFNLRHFSR